MEETKPNDKQKEVEKPTTEAAGEGDKPKPVNALDRADEIRKGMDEANKKHEELTKRDEEIAARKMLGGDTEAGTLRKSPEETMEETSDKQAEEIVNRFN